MKLKKLSITPLWGKMNFKAAMNHGIPGVMQFLNASLLCPSILVDAKLVRIRKNVLTSVGSKPTFWQGEASQAKLSRAKLFSEKASQAKLFAFKT